MTFEVILNLMKNLRIHNVNIHIFFCIIKIGSKMHVLGGVFLNSRRDVMSFFCEECMESNGGRNQSYRSIKDQ